MFRTHLKKIFEKDGQRQTVVKCENENEANSHTQQLLSKAADSKKYFEFLLQISRIYIALKGLWNEATILFLYGTLFLEKIITQLDYFFEKCRVWQLRVTDGTKLVHINQNRKSKNSVFFSEWNLGDLSATKFYLYLNAVFLENLPNLLLTNGKVYICSNQILFPTNLHLLMVLMESPFLK